MGESSFFCSHKFLDLFYDSLHVLRVRVSFVVGDAVDSEINRLFDVLLRPSATSEGSGQSSSLQILSVSRGILAVLDLV